MSKVSRRPNREQIKARDKATKLAQKELRQKQIEEGLTPLPHSTISNGKSKLKTEEEQEEMYNDATWHQLKVFRAHLPKILKDFSAIPENRELWKIKHQLSALLLYGLLRFVLCISSSRKATREMSEPKVWANLKYIFPELENIPHHDTLKRLLSQIDVSQIENIHLDMVRKLIRNKKFSRYLINNCYPIAIDGTQKMARDHLWAEECLERTRNKGKDTEETDYYVNVAQANLAFAGGMSIPLVSEFLEYSADNTGNNKQDCETKAFYRLAERLKKEFPSLRIMLLLDGLYAKGPIMEVIRENKWQYMIVLKEGSMPATFQEFEALKKINTNNRHFRTWGNRKQHFKWVNDIDYRFGPNEKKQVILHIVECWETWQEVDRRTSEVVDKSSRHVWISSEPLEWSNLHERCNLGARSRWTIEENFLVEKHQGYHYEHCFSYDWNAMKGFHYLMQLGHLFNILARYSKELAKIIKDTGVQGLIRLVRKTLSSPWFNKRLIGEVMGIPYQLRLI
jgi:hypothetical protein